MLGHQIIKMPAPNETLQVMEHFENIADMPGIIGCIDCTHIQITKPPGDRSETFRNRKGKFSINVQAVCGPQLQFFNIVAKWPGSAHDSNIFNRSRLCAEMEEGIHRGILLSDAGYACRNFLFTPLRNPQSVEERRYNTAQVKTRNCIERAFGVLKRRFACLGKTLCISLDNTLAVIVVAAVLHNIAIQENIPLPDEPEMDQNHDHEAENYPEMQAQVNGNVARQRYIREYF
ncbi:putative nuclease HARBI1 [Portunus trituberculatus]|uniref:putative nuclease HARBI1 n=1 Tax=Portunus trituberculatus TaxID=210409 RepID=UPI001E1CF9B4|nr:putative nuclease HARBI1 [Portunus trituberculatus]XP_045124756.1 putative nuclease HARBI1 [Portunus trituberculatus]